MNTPEKTRLERAHAWVDAAYAALSKSPDFVARMAQIELSKETATAFLEGRPLVAEAPTGTGKTVAYLVGALAVSETAATPTSDPVIVSTATKALQQQLIVNDLPRLARTGLIRLSEVGLAKGKSNYLCIRSAEETAVLLERGESDPELFLASAHEDMDPDEVGAMVTAFDTGRWDGDFDSYDGRRPRNVFPIAVNGDTCAGKKCSRYNSCAYFNAKAKLSSSRIIVANHDLVLRDLLLAQLDLASLPVANYMVVFDEGHHLPDKAIAVGSSEAALTSLQRALPKLVGLQKLVKGSPELAGVLARAGIKEAMLDRSTTGAALKALLDELAGLEVDEDNGVRRFAKGEISPAVQAALTGLQEPLNTLVGALGGTVGVLKEATLSAVVQEKANEAMRRSLDVKSLGDDVLKCISRLLTGKRSAKWMFRKDGVLSLHTAPLEGADVLDELLWKNTRAKGAVLVSATLRDLGGFTRFARRVGLPPTAQFKVLPYTFPYKESRLTVAPMKATPKPAERRLFLPELAKKLPAAVDPREGTLILFPSWGMLREFAPQLKVAFGESRVKVQGEHTVKMLVSQHCADVDAKRGSVLMGVATLSEGLDLPGSYCTHVIIVALPFAVPTDPVEQELSDILGTKYFAERSLPDATTRLVQMVGRLLRRESDRGRITIFDRRLASTSYGRQMLNSLPPFEKVIEPVVD